MGDVDPKNFFLLVAALAACHRNATGTSPPAQARVTTGVDATTPAPSASGPPAAPPPSHPDAALESGALALPDRTPDAEPADQAAPLLNWTHREPPVGEPLATEFSCEALARRNDRVLAFPTGKCDGYKADVAATLGRAMSATSLSHSCHEGHGRWAIELLGAELDDPAWEAGGCGWAATYRFVFLPTSGAPAEVTRSSAFEWRAFADEQVEISKQVPFDYDADGRDELLVHQTRWGNGEGSTATLFLLTSSGTPYPVGFGFDGVADGDGDGRPDLLEARYFAVDSLCGGPGAYEEHGAALLVHSLPDGTFSMSDEVSREWARAECPSSSPKADDGCVRGASCLRLWGKTEADIAAWMQHGAGCDSPQCFPPDAAKQIAATPLPFPPLTTAIPPAPQSHHIVLAAPPEAEAKR